MGNTTTIIIGSLLLIVLLLGGYSVMVTREAGAHAQRIEDQEREIRRLTDELEIRARQVASSEAAVRQFKADQETLRRSHLKETQTLKAAMADLEASTRGLETELAARSADAKRLAAEIRRQRASLKRLQTDRQSDQKMHSELQTTIDRLHKELAANETIIVELKNDRESIACLERDVPDVVMDRLLGGGVRHGKNNGD